MPPSPLSLLPRPRRCICWLFHQMRFGDNQPDPAAVAAASAPLPPAGAGGGGPRAAAGADGPAEPEAAFFAASCVKPLYRLVKAAEGKKEVTDNSPWRYVASCGGLCGRGARRFVSNSERINYDDANEVSQGGEMAVAAVQPHQSLRAPSQTHHPHASTRFSRTAVLLVARVPGPRVARGGPRGGCAHDRPVQDVLREGGLHRHPAGVLAVRAHKPGEWATPTPAIDQRRSITSSIPIFLSPPPQLVRVPGGAVHGALRRGARHRRREWVAGENT
jgi:hypothetical protein